MSSPPLVLFGLRTRILDGEKWYRLKRRARLGLIEKLKDYVLVEVSETESQKLWKMYTSMVQMRLLHGKHARTVYSSA